jgi:hypothetical protein
MDAGAQKSKHHRVVGCTTLHILARLLLFVLDVKARREEANCWWQVMYAGVRNPVKSNERRGMWEVDVRFSSLSPSSTINSCRDARAAVMGLTQRTTDVSCRHRSTELGSEETTRTSKESG